MSVMLKINKRVGVLHDTRQENELETPGRVKEVRQIHLHSYTRCYNCDKMFQLFFPIHITDQAFIFKIHCNTI